MFDIGISYYNAFFPNIFEHFLNNKITVKPYFFSFIVNVSVPVVMS